LYYKFINRKKSQELAREVHKFHQIEQIAGGIELSDCFLIHRDRCYRDALHYWHWREKSEIENEKLKKKKTSQVAYDSKANAVRFFALIFCTDEDQ